MPPEWTLHDWERALAATDRLTLREHRAALARLRFVFPPDLVGVLRANGHPVVEDQLTYPGRIKLLELGHAIVAVGLDEGDLRRLRDRAEYEETSAELRAALFFAKAGARPEARSRGRLTPGPASGTTARSRAALRRPPIAPEIGAARAAPEGRARREWAAAPVALFCLTNMTRSTRVSSNAQLRQAMLERQRRARA